MTKLFKYRIVWITLLFALGGGAIAVLLKAGELQWYYMAFTPFFALLVCFLTTFLLKAKWNLYLRHKLKMVSAVLFSLFIILFFLYINFFRKATFGYKEFDGTVITYVKGNEYTPVALQYKNEHPNLASDDAALLYDGFGGPEGKNEVWSQASVDKNIFLLVSGYSILVIILAALVSLLAEVSFEKINAKKAIESLLEDNNVSNYNTYVTSYSQKQMEAKYKNVKFNIFLSYSSNQRNEAENIYYSLINNGHMVFFDRDSLPKGMEYNTAIRNAIFCSDIMIFLISPDSTANGHYTLSELKFARERWPGANGNLFPVMAVETAYENIPAYAKSVTIFKAEGNLVAELTAEIENMYISKTKK